MVRAWTLIGLLLLGCGLLQAAELRLEIPQPVPVGQRVRGDLQLIDAEGTYDNVQLPQSPDYQLQLHTNQRSSQTQIVNGQRSTTISFACDFIARQKGPLTVGPVVLTSSASGERLQSEPITVTTFQPRTDLTEPCLAEISFEPARIVPGEPAQMQYRVYLDQSRNLTINSLGVDLPEGAIALGERQDETVSFRSDDGRAWALVTLTWPFTMSQPGDYRVSGQQSYGVNQRDFFRARFQQVGTVAVRPAVLRVDPLPSLGRPVDFSGLIGQTTIRAELERSRITSGEGTRLLLTLTGTQLDLLRSLPAPDIPGVQAYPHELPEAGSSDVRRFAWDLVPSRAGSYTIPPQTVSWFDPTSRSYKTSSSQALHLEVLPGRQRNVDIVGQLTAPEAAQAETITGPQLPAPLQGDASAPVPPRQILLTLLISFGISLGLGAGWRLAKRAPRQEHPADTAHRAIEAGDLPTANAALARLRTRARPEQRAQIDQLLAAVEQARFGGGQLSEEVLRAARALPVSSSQFPVSEHEERPS